MPRPFLSARWSHIIVLTFEAPEELIRRSIPPGVEPDRWNGRTHVRVAGEPGVWFVRQFVPSRLIAAVGRLRYGEPFWPTPIRSRVLDLPGELRAEYAVGPPAFGWHVSVTGSRAAQVPPPDSSEHHFIERAFACRTRPGGN